MPVSLTEHQQTAIRNAGWLAAMRGLQVVTGVLYAAVVPRLMGPAGYGQMALVVALSMWFTALAELGLTEVLGTQGPRYIQADDQAGLTGFFSRLLAIRTLAGVVAAACYLVMMTLWLRDLDRLALALLALAIAVRAPAALAFALQLGLNRAARWGLPEFARQWGYMLVMLPGFRLGGLRGAALGVLLVEAIIAVIGLVGARPHLLGSAMRAQVSRMKPYLRFGLVFYAGDLLLTAVEPSGVVLLRCLCHDYSQVAFFCVACSGYATLAAAIPSVALAFAPLLTMLQHARDSASMDAWTKVLAKWLSLGCLLLLLATSLLAREIVPWVLGDEFVPVALNLMVLTAGLLPLSFTCVANVMALVHNRPSVALVGAAVRVVTFWLSSPLLIARLGSLGASLGVLAAVLAQAVYAAVAMRRVLAYSWRRCLLAIATAALLLPLASLRLSLLGSMGLLCVAVLACMMVLFRLGLVTSEEFRTMRNALAATSRSGSESARGIEATH